MSTEEQYTTYQTPEGAPDTDVMSVQAQEDVAAVHGLGRLRQVGRDAVEVTGHAIKVFAKGTVAELPKISELTDKAYRGDATLDSINRFSKRRSGLTPRSKHTITPEDF